MFALLICVYFQSGVSRALSVVAHAVFRPVLYVGGSIGDKFSGIGAYFSFKSTLALENNRLKNEMKEMGARVSNYSVVLEENISIKEKMGRAVGLENTILSAVLSKPNQSPYDTIIIDIGANKNVSVGDRVFALGGIPIGKVSAVYSYSSNVVLFSSSGEKTEVVITGENAFVQLVGRGGGNFEMILPRDFMLTKGEVVVLPGIRPYTVAVSQNIISDPRDSFQKVLFVSPVNIQEIKFVEVEKNSVAQN